MLSRRRRFRRLWFALAAVLAVIGGYVLVVEVLVVPGWPANTVQVATSDRQWRDGVKAVQLQPGESLGFDAGGDVVPVWNMAGVSYPLVLSALDRRGKTLATIVMKPCKSGSVSRCPQYLLDVSARYWVETRPVGSKVQKESEGQR